MFIFARIFYEHPILLLRVFCLVDPLAHVLRGFRESLLEKSVTALVTPGIQEQQQAPHTETASLIGQFFPLLIFAVAVTNLKFCEIILLSL